MMSSPLRGDAANQIVNQRRPFNMSLLYPLKCANAKLFSDQQNPIHIVKS